MRYCISYIIVLILPIVFIATSFNTRFIAGYRQSLTNQIKLTAQKAMSDLERQLGQMALQLPRRVRVKKAISVYGETGALWFIGGYAYGYYI